jgi:serine/threonine protein kinase
VDIWSIGCIFAEMINGNPLFTGTSEDTQLDTIFRHLGTPDESTFPGISELPDWRSDFPNYPPPDSLHVLVPNLEQSGVELLQVSQVAYHVLLDHLRCTNFSVSALSLDLSVSPPAFALCHSLSDSFAFCLSVRRC